MKGTVSLVFILFLLCCLPIAALAHKVTIFAYTEGDTVYSQSYSSDSDPVVGGVVTVADADGKELLHGKTDVSGHYNFPLPAKNDLYLTLDASMGHKATFILKMDEDGQSRPKQKSDGAGLIQIVAGIGCIAGLFGAAVFFASRKKQKNK
ncbi:MAG TPA: hypothetical protein DEB25_07510 [Desulfobulbaceae bacterium]|nr:hypothetical protein [Desulfobulbaceae bacterium]